MLDSPDRRSSEVSVYPHFSHVCVRCGLGHSKRVAAPDCQAHISGAFQQAELPAHIGSSMATRAKQDSVSKTEKVVTESPWNLSV